MPMFKVELDRRIFAPGEIPRNPFLAGMPQLGATHEVSVRAWEFEAKDEKEVRRLLDQAYKQDLPNVRGYKLRSITRLPEKASADGRGPNGECPVCGGIETCNPGCADGTDGPL